MAHRGPASKTVKHGRTPGAEGVDVVDVPFPGPSPELPKLPNKRKYNDMTVQWWEQVRTMPHCVLWSMTDWQFAIETALMKDQFWRDFFSEGEMKSTVATEIRRREGMLGTTSEARRQLRIRYVPPGGAEEEYDEPPTVIVEQEQGSASSGVATVTPLADRRARLTRAS